MQKRADEYVDGGYEECGDAVPSVVGLSCELGVKRDTLRDWAEKNEKFSATLDKCDSVQHRVALSGGLRGEFNAAITKLLLHNHGYSDKSAQELTGKDGKDLQAVVVLPAKNGDD
jgi:hypothetical protein